MNIDATYQYVVLNEKKSSFHYARHNDSHWKTKEKREYIAFFLYKLE